MCARAHAHTRSAPGCPGPGGPATARGAAPPCAAGAQAQLQRHPAPCRPPLTQPQSQPQPRRPGGGWPRPCAHNGREQQGAPPAGRRHHAPEDTSIQVHRQGVPWRHACQTANPPLPSPRYRRPRPLGRWGVGPNAVCRQVQSRPPPPHTHAHATHTRPPTWTAFMSCGLVGSGRRPRRQAPASTCSIADRWKRRPTTAVRISTQQPTQAGGRPQPPSPSKASTLGGPAPAAAGSVGPPWASPLCHVTGCGAVYAPVAAPFGPPVCFSGGRGGCAVPRRAAEGLCEVSSHFVLALHHRRGAT